MVAGEGGRVTAPAATTGDGRARDGQISDRPVIDAEFRAMGLQSGFADAPSGGGPIVLAVSGGGDSMALACLATRWARWSGRRLLAVTVDHGLRPGSADEARHVGHLLAPLGIRHRVATWRHEPITSGIQAKAREARYRLLLSECREVGADWLLTAHNAEDQAETIAMRVLRRSGPDGLAGMPHSRELGGREPSCVRHGRPLLGWSRSALRQVCRDAGLDWIEDPSNDNAAFTRIALRRVLSPAAVVPADTGPKIGPDTDHGPADLSRDLLRLGRAMGVARRHIEHAVRTAIEEAVSITEDGGAEMAVGILSSLRPAIAHRVLARVLTAVGGRSFPVDAADGAKVAAALAGGQSGALAAGRALSLAGCLSCLANGRSDGPFVGETVLALMREPGRVSARIAVEAGTTCRWDHRFLVGPAPASGWIVARRTVTDAVVGSGNDSSDTQNGIRDGDHLTPIGCGGRQGANARLATLPVLCDDAGRLIAAPDRTAGGIGGGQGRERFGFRFAPTIDPGRCDFGVVGTG